MELSVCIIMKNEEFLIENCLKTLSKYPFELVITDTGSTDNSVAIARKYTNNIYRYYWDQNFSNARNYCISKATHPYILVIDCDEQIDSIELELLSELLQSEIPSKIGLLTRNNLVNYGGVESIMSEKVARLFHKDYTHYKGSIHEQALPIDALAPVYFDVPITITHLGYNSTTLKFSKAKRNLEMLKLALIDNKEDPYLLFQIGQSYQAMNEYDRAVTYYDQALFHDLDPNAEYVQTMIESYGYCLIETKNYSKALQLENLMDFMSHRSDFLFLMGLIYMNVANFQKAIDTFTAATKAPRTITLGTNSYMAYYNIGVIYECLKDIQNAKSYYLLCGNFELAMNRLKLLNN